MIPALVCIAVVLTLQSVVLVWNLVYWKRRAAPTSAGDIRLSVLIPARNEAHNLPGLLTALAAQSLCPLEIIICDDCSEDGTGEWLAANAQAYGAKWFEGAEKPPDWSGKNWACHQLAERAQGDWLMFLDADVRPEADFLATMAGAMNEKEALLVTAFPRIDPAGVGDGLLIAMVPFSVFTTLPLVHAEHHSNPAFAFANGQVICFAREEYRRLTPHLQVRQMLLEDVALARLSKQLGRRVCIVDAGRVLRVRMYNNTAEAVRGFARNAVAICGRPRTALLAAVMLVGVYILPWVWAVQGQWAAVAVVLWGALLYGAAARLGGLGWWYGLLTPVAIVLAVITTVQSVIWHWRGAVPWRGRIYGPPQA